MVPCAIVWLADDRAASLVIYYTEVAEAVLLAAPPAGDIPSAKIPALNVTILWSPYAIPYTTSLHSPTRGHAYEPVPMLAEALCANLFI